MTVVAKASVVVRQIAAVGVIAVAEATVVVCVV